MNIVQVNRVLDGESLCMVLAFNCHCLGVNGRFYPLSTHPMGVRVCTRGGLVEFGLDCGARD